MRFPVLSQRLRPVLALRKNMLTQRDNRLLGTDMQQQEAAPRHLLHAGQRQRYAACI